ncbi:MAG: hypothetical protein IT340_19260 [Chloroflexi bacterium]|nr:hypothetical protein [Chloroflexota bacterium]
MRLLMVRLVLAALFLAGALPVAAAPTAAVVETRYLIADYDNNRVLEVNSTGAVQFRYGEPATKKTVIEAPARAFRLANGNTMMVDNGEIDTNPRVFGRALEVTPSGAIVNQVTGLFLPTDVQVLPNGKWLISELSKYRRRVIEVAPGTVVTDATPAVYQNQPTGKDAPVGVFSAVRLPNGNTVISDHGLGKVAEISPAGNVIRQKTGLGAPTRVSVTPDGTWLIPEKTRFQVLEYNPDTGQTVRTFITGKNPGPVNRTKFLLGSAERLPNGNTLIADGENNRVIEMDNSGTVVQTLPNPTGNLGSGSGQTCLGASVATYGCPYDASYVPDFTKPVIVSVTPSTTTTANQRIQMTVVAIDPPSTGSSRSGVATYDYSLDGVTFRTGLTITPAIEPGPQTFDVDLANPGAGGNWNPGQKIVRVRVADQEGRQSDVVTSTVTFNPRPVTVRYFAEGYTGPGFDEYVTIGNPNGVAIQVAIFFQYAAGSSGVPGTIVAVEANQRATLSINAAAGPSKELSLRLESDFPFIAERPMYFSNYGSGAARASYNRPGIATVSGVNGGHLGVAAPAPAPAWYFAEGYTGAGFDTYFTIYNPSAASSAVSITYFLDDGPTQDRPLTVGAGQRRTVSVHSAADPAGLGPGRAFSAKVATTNGQNLVVERVTYFRYSSAEVGTVTGGGATLGATVAATTWHFAEGYTGGGFDEYLTIQNPNPAMVTGTITYYVEGEGATSKPITLLPSSRTTVPVHDATHPAALGRGKAHATTVQTSQPTVVERPMYFLYAGATIAGIDGGHNVMGATSLLQAGQSVLFAEGYTGQGFEQYLTLQNPNPTAATVRITYLLAGGAPQSPPLVTIPANQRKTIVVHAAGNGGLGPNMAFSTKVDVVNGGAGGVLAERVMYFRYHDVATGGTSAFGALLP